MYTALCFRKTEYKMKIDKWEVEISATTVPDAERSLHQLVRNLYEPGDELEFYVLDSNDLAQAASAVRIRRFNDLITEEWISPKLASKRHRLTGPASVNHNKWDTDIDTDHWYLNGKWVPDFNNILSATDKLQAVHEYIEKWPGYETVIDQLQNAGIINFEPALLENVKLISQIT